MQLKKADMKNLPTNTQFVLVWKWDDALWSEVVLHDGKCYYEYHQNSDTWHPWLKESLDAINEVYIIE